MSRIDALQTLWAEAGLINARTRKITVARAFEDFEDYWASMQIALGMGQSTREMGLDVKARLKEGLRALGLSREAVKGRLNRARTALREYLMA